MEKQKDISGMLEMIPQPSFFVKDGSVILANRASQQLFIEPGMAVSALLGDHAEEYADFDGGCLWLTLTLSGCSMHASVTRFDQSDLFVVEPIADQAELKAMALAAMEFREPLSGVITITDYLLPNISTDDDASTREKIGQMNRRLNQMHRMVCNMTDAIHYAGNTTPRMVYQDVCSVFEELFERIGTLVGQAGVQLRYQGPREPVYSMIAPDRLERSVHNIISNAMKHATDGCVIDAKLSRKGNKLYLSIQDNGNGIPEHMLGSIYSRYLRQPSIEAQSAGLGLGMVLIRGTAAAHGGTVLVTRPNGCGTRVTMSLTIQRDPSNLHSTVLTMDYAGERDHVLLELSDVLPSEFYI